MPRVRSPRPTALPTTSRRSRRSRTRSATATTSATARSRPRSSSRLQLGRPLLLEGEAGVGKTELAKVLAASLGARLIRLQCYEGLDVNAAVYEWNYPRQMLEIRLLEARGEADARERPRHLRPGVPDPAAAAPGARGRRRRRAAGPADRRDRPGRRGVRGVPARDPLGLPGDRAGDRHDQGRAAAARDPHLEPDPRGPRRAEAPLPLPLDRLPVGPEGVRDRPRPACRRRRSGSPARSSASSTASARPT